MAVVYLNKMKPKSGVVFFYSVSYLLLFFNGESDQMLRNMTLANKNMHRNTKNPFDSVA